MKINHESITARTTRLWEESMGVNITVVYNGDRDRYVLTLTNPYRGDNVSEVSRGEGEHDEPFFNRAMATAYSEISTALGDCAQIQANENRIQYELGLIREEIDRLTGQIDHFDFDPLDARQLSQVNTIRKRMGEICDMMAEAS